MSIGFAFGKQPSLPRGPQAQPAASAARAFSANSNAAAFSRCRLPARFHLSLGLFGWDRFSTFRIFHLNLLVLFSIK